jgi:hypothetical protein
MQRRFHHYPILFLAVLLFGISAQPGWAKLPHGKRHDPAKLARRITAHCSSETEKAETIYRWVTRHIRYDFVAFMHFRSSLSDPRWVLKRRRAVCEGYARLFQAMCDGAGLDSYLIYGHVKGAFYREGEEFLRAKHAWNGLVLEGRPVLVDATWGSGYITHRNQPLREWMYRKFEIPFLPKLKYVRKPNMMFFKADPDSFLYHHLPIDPKWQLQDSAITQQEWETDSVLPCEPIAFFPEIKAETPLTEVQRQVVEGTNGLEWNPRDPFDLGAAQVEEANEIIQKVQHPSTDTMQWHDAMEEFKKAHTHLVAYKAIVVPHHRKRLKELGERRHNNMFAENKSIRDGVVAHSQVTRESMRTRRKDRALIGMAIQDEDVDIALRDPRVFRVRITSKVDTLKWAPLRLAMEKTEMEIHRLDSENTVRQTALHDIADQMIGLQDSLLSLRRHAQQNLRQYTWELMLRNEVQFFGGNKILNAIEDSIAKLVQRSYGLIRQDDKAFALQVARHGQVNRHFLKSTSQIQRLVSLGMPLTTGQAKLTSIAQAHQAWVAKRNAQKDVLAQLRQRSLDIQMKSSTVASRCSFLGRWQRMVFVGFHWELWGREQADFNSDMRLASDLIRTAKSGVGHLRSQIAFWLAEKRRQEAAALHARR